jgi:hypothetical protein
VVAVVLALLLVVPDNTVAVTVRVETHFLVPLMVRLTPVAEAVVVLGLVDLASSFFGSQQLTIVALRLARQS